MHCQCLPCMCLATHSYAANKPLIRRRTSANTTIRKLKSISICGIHSKSPAAPADLKCKESKYFIFVKHKTKPNQTPTPPK